MAAEQTGKTNLRNVAYFFDEELCNYNYGGGNPMRPHRHRLTSNLVRGYGLEEKLQIIRPRARTRDEIMHFHADGERLWQVESQDVVLCGTLESCGLWAVCRGTRTEWFCETCLATSSAMKCWCS
jgi:acetoin utilization deacetylase AcuC-like enzyme